MKTKILLVIVGITLLVLTGALVAVPVLMVLDNRALREESRALRAELKEAREDSDQLRSQVLETTDRLIEKHGAFEQEVKRAEAAEAKAAGDMRALMPQRPKQLRVFLGSQYLGLGWLVPPAVSADKTADQAGYDPVFLLDESMRRNLVVQQTNVVEREVWRETTVNYNYPYNYPYYWYPGFVTGGTHPPPNCGTNPPIRQPLPDVLPPTSQPFLNTKYTLPKEKPFLPPIQSRPQPINGPARIAPVQSARPAQPVNRPLVAPQSPQQLSRNRL